MTITKCILCIFNEHNFTGKNEIGEIHISIIKLKYREAAKSEKFSS